MAVYAAIDIGTNTLRLIVAEAVSADHYTVLHEEQTIGRLVKDYCQAGCSRTRPCGDA